MARGLPSLSHAFRLSDPVSASGRLQSSETDVQTPGKLEVTYDASGEPEGLKRFRQWSPTLYQGAQPQGDVAFKNLAAMGVKTVISVDGAIPDLESAHKYGLKYAHIPMGYDGVPEDVAVQVLRAYRDAAGPVFVHCHHGKHRGPAAMMTLRIGIDGISNEQAIGEMKMSKTSPHYEGLYGDIGKFRKLTDAQFAKAPESIPEKVVPDGLLATMVDVNLRWDNLRLSRSADWGVPPESPDVSPPHEARMMWELYRESLRAGHGKEHGEKFLALYRAGESSAIELENALRAGDKQKAEQHYQVLKANCKACHSSYRD